MTIRHVVLSLVILALLPVHTLSCASDAVDSGVCGDAVIDSDEQCEGTNFGGLNCSDYGFNGGFLLCTDCQIDESNCTASGEVCGNGTIGGAEECEGTNLNGASCESLGFTSGTLACIATTCMYDNSGCTMETCGNGDLDPGEQCDDGNTNNGDGCSSNCQNEANCGNGTAEGTEECDTYDFNSTTCVTLGYDGGDVSCSSSCTIIDSACYNDPVCTIVASPASGYTADFTPQTDCTCTSSDPDCHILYRGRVDSLAGNLVDLSFTKAQNGGGPSENIHYWVVVGPQNPVCTDVVPYSTADRADGTWTTSQSTLSVTGVSVWPSQTEFDNDPPNTTKSLFIVTGGGGIPNTPTYFQQTPILFTKMCQ